MESSVISEVLARITINSHRMIHRAYGLLRTWSHVGGQEVRSHHTSATRASLAAECRPARLQHIAYKLSLLVYIKCLCSWSTNVTDGRTTCNCSDAIAILRLVRFALFAL